MSLTKSVRELEFVALLENRKGNGRLHERIHFELYGQYVLGKSTRSWVEPLYESHIPGRSAVKVT